MEIIAYRGSAAIKDDIELKAYLASLLRLENVGVFLGAGASCSAGGKTMASLWRAFLSDEAASAQWLLDEGFIDEAKNTGSLSANGIVDHSPNIEFLIDKLEIAIIEWERRADSILIKAKQVRAALFRSIIRAARLKEEWWGTLGGADLTDELGVHRTLLQKLTSARQPGQFPPWIFTTNYDLAIEWAAESVDLQVINGFLGVHSRRFSPQSFDLGFRNIQARGEARFGVYNIYLAKLHGSLTWKEVDFNLFEVPAAQAWPDLKSFLDGETDELGYMVMPRAAKYVQTVGYVLGEMLRRFAEFMGRPQTAMLIAGYGFGDEHINRLIRSALLNPTLQVVIYLPEFNGDVTDPRLAPTVQRLLALNNPRLTIVGGGDNAFFSALASHLPDPTIYDEQFTDLERKLRPREPDPSKEGS